MLTSHTADDRTAATYAVSVPLMVGSAALREYAGLEKKLMLVGQGKKLELWSEANWFDYLDAADGDDAVPEEVLALSL